jgi:uncharacterized protein YbjT (DUF2867 family)
VVASGCRDLHAGTTLRNAGSPAAFRRVDFDYVLEFARLARAGCARAFALTSSLGADAASRYFYLRTKGEVEQAVQALGYPSLTVVRPSLIGRERQRRRLLEHIGMRLLQTLAPCAPRRYRIVSAERIAQTLLRPALELAPRLVGDLPGTVAVVRENQGDARGTLDCRRARLGQASTGSGSGKRQHSSSNTDGRYRIDTRNWPIPWCRGIATKSW